jgi:hypothetical protein
MVDSLPPAEGPVRPVSVPLHKGTISAFSERAAKRGMPAYVEALIQRQLERERLRELIEEAEAHHGPADQAAVEAKRAILRGEQPGSTDAAGAERSSWTAK